MRFSAHVRHLLTVTFLSASLAVPVFAQELVSVRSPTVNLRAGPGTDSGVLWKLSRGYPLQVLERKGQWLRVQDFEGDQGWVAQTVTAETPHHVVKSKVANLRAGPSMQHRIVGKVAYGDVLRTVRRQGDWVVVQSPSGKGQAWVSSNLVWGW